ncbi:MAG TPA: hypothetical protein VLG74_17290 [Blastocatellia bacterium]|nr:hypothetical protein [Blastocatellia bacterium]
MIKRLTFPFFGLGLLLISLFDLGVAQQQVNDLAEVATGEGNLTWTGGEKLQINSVVVFLRRDGEAEIWLLTDKQNVYAGGRWFHNGSGNRAVDLAITDDTQGGCAIGCATVFLRQGCVPIAGLRMTGTTAGITFAADFVAKNPRPCDAP